MLGGTGRGVKYRYPRIFEKLKFSSKTTGKNFKAPDKRKNIKGERKWTYIRVLRWKKLRGKFK